VPDPLTDGADQGIDAIVQRLDLPVLQLIMSHEPVNAVLQLIHFGAELLERVLKNDLRPQQHLEFLTELFMFLFDSVHAPAAIFGQSYSYYEG
jgi:hypothetical protein